MAESKPETLEDKIKRKRLRDVNDLKMLLSIPEGRRFFFRVLAKCEPFKDGFTNDPYAHAYSSGKKFIGHWIFSEIMEANQGSFNQILREHSSEEKRKEREQEELSKNRDILNIGD